MKTLPDTLRAFLAAYQTCALWSSTDDAGTPLDELGVEFAGETETSMQQDCFAFMRDHADAWREAGMSDEQAGHDFWLTRNGHGAGFWDRGLGEAGDRLTALAEAYGSSDLYIGDNGYVYAS